MKKLLSGLALAGVFFLANAQTISFDKTTWEYGTIKKGADGHRIFTVKNTGDKPLILSKVKASCGCTVPSWDKSPIPPGGTGKIKVGYNTSLTGNFRKLIEVYSNDPKNSRSVLYITGTVEGDGKKATVKKKITPLEETQNKAKYYEQKIEKLESSIASAKKELKEAKKNLKDVKQVIKKMKKKGS